MAISPQLKFIFYAKNLLGFTLSFMYSGIKTLSSGGNLLNTSPLELVFNNEYFFCSIISLNSVSVI